MHKRQTAALPTRTYEPTIIHNPFTWMGIWTPHGWRVHKKRWGEAERLTVRLSGDGQTTFFPEALLDPQSGTVGWQDDLHLHDDPFTDDGIYPCDPRVEYPAGQPRWAVSHTLFCYPVADHGLYTHEYTWDMVHGHLQTHFRHHVALEEATTDSRNGSTVRLKHAPLSLTIEGNVHYPLANSAVRGVWTTPDKTGPNLYARRVVQVMPMLNGTYGVTPYCPVVQCHGIYQLMAEDLVEDPGLFEAATGECKDWDYLLQQRHIPLDVPKLGWLRAPVKKVSSSVYESEIGMLAEDVGIIGADHLDKGRERIGASFSMGKVGYGFEQKAGSDFSGYRGYVADFDLNNDGVIDDDDIALLESHVGRQVRYNIYKDAYFGGDWLSASYCLEPEHQPGVQVIADYEYGAGYDAQAGVVKLLETPGPDKKVFVEYHYDAPADAGSDNIVVHLYRERR